MQGTQGTQRRGGSVDGPAIWYRDPVGFLFGGREQLASFVPERDTPLASQLNASMRFALYLALVVLLLRRTLLPPIAILVTAGVATYAIYQSELGVDGDVRERMDALDIERDPATGRLCTRPTLNNPYMNVLLTDINRYPDRPQACDITRPDVRLRADDLSAHNLYVDSDDIYGVRSGGNNAFYTTASTTIPNDQTGFAQWLYGSGPTCRDGFGDACAASIYHLRPGR